MNRQGRRGQGWQVLLLLTVAVLVTAMGILHVSRAKQEFALRQGIWAEVRELGRLDQERARTRHRITELLAVPRTAVKAEVLGLRPAKESQVLDLNGLEE